MLGIMGSLLGSVASGAMSLFGQNSANSQMERMSNTAYQRSSADMTAAGLNPAAMFGSGGPAGVPTMQNTMAGPAAAMKDAASSATQQMIAQKTIDQLTEQIAKTKVEAANVKANTGLTLAQTPGVASDSSLKVGYGDAIRAIPRKVYAPLVQAGFGAHTMRDTGGLGAAAGAGAASAKAVASGLSDFAPSGPAISSAKSKLSELAQAYKEKSPALFEAIGDWWSRTHPNQVQYKSN